MEAAWETERYAKTTGKAMPHDCGISFRLLKERKKCLKLSIKEIAKVNHVKFMVMIILKTLRIYQVMSKILVTVLKLP